jgi:hypothetical protein
MNEQDLRDCFAMFSMVGLVMAYKDNHPENELAQRAELISMFQSERDYFINL